MSHACPKTMDELVDRWTDLEGKEIAEAVCVPEILCRLKGAAHLALGLAFTDPTKYFLVDFWARAISGARSPFALLNTRVSDGHGTARPWYRDILSLLRVSFPPHTTLVTFVRQSDSLELLEHARRIGRRADPREIPLVRMFEDAGWAFERLSFIPSAEHPRRRHLIRFTTLP